MKNNRSSAANCLIIFEIRKRDGGAPKKTKDNI